MPNASYQHRPYRSQFMYWMVLKLDMHVHIEHWINKTNKIFKIYIILEILGVTALSAPLIGATELQHFATKMADTFEELGRNSWDFNFYLGGSPFTIFTSFSSAVASTMTAQPGFICFLSCCVLVSGWVAQYRINRLGHRPAKSDSHFHCLGWDCIFSLSCSMVGA